MGGGYWDSKTYSSYASSTGLTNGDVKITAKGLLDYTDLKSKKAKKAPHEIFTNTHIAQALDPKKAKVRESRDSKDHPKSHPSIFGIDVTGSMGFISQEILQESLPKMMEQLFLRKPVTDLQVMFQAIDDIAMGGHFQVSQFESDIRIAKQLHEVWLEGGGGANNSESYTLPWYFANYHCVTDAWEKRGELGTIYTIGDEEPNEELDKHHLKNIFGEVLAQGPTDTPTLLKQVEEKWHVFHVIIEEGSYARSNLNKTRSAWNDLLGKGRVISLPDHRALAEVVVSSMQIAYGADPEEVAKSWEDTETTKIVKLATKNIKRIVEV
jgi:hypothetical protein